MKSKEFATARIEGQSNCLLTPLTSLTSLTPIIRKTMKKTYISPAALTVQLGSRDALLQSVSSTESLNGTSFGGKTSSGRPSEGDVKESKSIWDEEW